jgi:hypothetical protein
MSMLSHDDFTSGAKALDHLAEVAVILAEMCDEIELLGARLCADPLLVASHLEDLQAIDTIAQKQRWLSEVIRADCKVSAIERIGVEDLKARLTALG